VHHWAIYIRVAGADGCGSARGQMQKLSEGKFHGALPLNGANLPARRIRREGIPSRKPRYWQSALDNCFCNKEAIGPNRKSLAPPPNFRYRGNCGRGECRWGMRAIDAIQPSARRRPATALRALTRIEGSRR
jgi:hypothetical protein